MDYKLTFDDGSSAYLAHHGVLGMKWGVRNAETRLKYQSGNGGLVKPSSDGGQGQTRGAGYSSGKKRGGLSEGQKRALKTAAIGLGTAAALGGAVYVGRNKAMSKLLLRQATKEAQHRTDLRNSNLSIVRGVMQKRKNEEARNAFMRAKKAGLNPTSYEGYGFNKSKDYLINRAVKKDKAFTAQVRKLRDENRKVFDTKMRKLNRQTKIGKAVVNGLTVTGGAVAVGAGVGTARAYNSSSKKR